MKHETRELFRVFLVSSCHVPGILVCVSAQYTAVYATRVVQLLALASHVQITMLCTVHMCDVLSLVS